MILTEEEREMLSGKCGEAVQWAMDFLVKLGDYFDAANLVNVKYVNILELMGTSERAYLELIDYFLGRAFPPRSLPLEEQGWQIHLFLNQIFFEDNEKAEDLRN